MVLRYAILILIFFGTNIATAENFPQQLGTYVSRSAYIHLADRNLKLDQQHALYLPAGTRFIAFDKNVIHNGRKRMLILTEGGLLGYLIASKPKLFWKPNEIFGSLKVARIAIIKKKTKISFDLDPSKGLSFQIWFTPREIYEVTDQNDEGVKLKVGNPKLSVLGNDASFIITVPHSIVSVLDKDNIKLDREAIRIYSRAILDKVVGVRKACGETNIKTFKIGGGVGFDIKKWFSFVKVGVEAETESITKFNSNENVNRFYFKRGSEISEIHRITKILECDLPKINYSYLNADGTEFHFDRNKLDDETKIILKFDKLTGRLIVSCRDQYFNAVNVMQKFGFENHQIEFALSRVADFDAIWKPTDCR